MGPSLVHASYGEALKWVLRVWQLCFAFCMDVQVCGLSWKIDSLNYYLVDQGQGGRGSWVGFSYAIEVIFTPTHCADNDCQLFYCRIFCMGNHTTHNQFLAYTCIFWPRFGVDFGPYLCWLTANHDFLFHPVIPSRVQPRKRAPSSKHPRICRLQSIIGSQAI